MLERLRRFSLTTLLLLFTACQANALRTPVATTTASPSSKAPTPIAIESDQILTSTLSNGWVEYTNNKDGFAIALPSQWGEIDLAPELLDASMKQMMKQNPGAAGIISNREVEQAAKAGIKLMGFDFSPLGQKSGYRSSVAVTKLQVPFTTSLDEVVSELLKRQEQMDTVVKPIQHERTRLNVGEAEKISYVRNMIDANGHRLGLDCTQYVILADDSIYILSLFTPTEYSKNYAQAFKQITDRFQFVK